MKLKHTSKGAGEEFTHGFCQFSFATQFPMSFGDAIISQTAATKGFIRIMEVNKFPMAAQSWPMDGMSGFVTAFAGESFITVLSAETANKAGSDIDSHLRLLQNADGVSKEFSCIMKPGHSVGAVRLRASGGWAAFLEGHEEG